MRIDYSEPKRSSVTSQSKVRPRKEPVSMITAIAIVSAVVAFVAGFGSGWLLSQRSAKKAFQAAMQQKSLENSPAQPASPPPPPSSVQPTPGPQQQAGAPAPQPAGQPGTEPPLSFYKALPSGQKSTVLGSGINSDDKAKQPLQAPLPSNINRPVPSAEGVKPVEKPNDKQGAKPPENSGYAVQVASYTLKSEAEALRSKLAGKGYQVSIIESNQGDKGTWYRVRVGKRLEQEAAKELAGKLGKGAIVIPDRE